LIAAGDPAHVAADDHDAAPRGGVPDVDAYRCATACLVGGLSPVALLRGVKDGLRGGTLRVAA